MSTTTPRAELQRILLDMIAPALTTADRRALVDGMLPQQALDDARDETLDQVAEVLGGPDRQYHEHWTDVFAAEAVESLSPDAVDGFLQDDPMARARLYVAWQDFCSRHRDAMRS